MGNKIRFLVIAMLMGSTLCGAQNASREAAREFNKKLGRGINFMASKINGNYHDPFDFNLIRENKFTHVRIGSRVWQYVGEAPDFTIDPDKLDSYQNAVDWALDHELMVVMDPIHAWEEYSDADLPMLVKLWQQIALRFAGYPLERVAFEIFNEPRTYDIDLQAMLEECIGVIREIPGHEERMVIVSGQSFSTRQALIDAFKNNVVFPTDDPYLIGTFHYYDPRPYTNQGDDGSIHWAIMGDNDPEWIETIDKFQEVVDANNQWAEVNDTEPLPIYNGEYGVDNGAPAGDRVKWLWWVRTVSEQMGFANSIWTLYNTSPDSKGLGPWTDLQKEDATTRSLPQDILDRYRNRYEGEKGTHLGGITAENMPGASGDSVAITEAGIPGGRVVFNNVYIGRGGLYDATFRYQNNSTEDIILMIACGSSTQLLDSVKLRIQPSAGEWMAATIPLEFPAGENNTILLRFDSPADNFQLDYLALTIGAWYDNHYPSTPAEVILAGLPEHHLHNFKVFPVPARDTLNIEGDFRQWTLYSPAGKRIGTGTDNKIKVKGLDSGIYILVVDKVSIKILVE